MAIADDLESAPVYASLIHTPMLFGLPQTLLIIILFGALIAAGMTGFNLLILGLYFALFLVSLPFLRRLFEKEPLAIELLQSYMRWPRILPHHARVDSTPRPDRVPPSFYH